MSDEKTRELAKYFELSTRELVEIPVGYIDEDTFGSIKGLNGEIGNLNDQGPKEDDHREEPEGQRSNFRGRKVNSERQNVDIEAADVKSVHLNFDSDLKDNGKIIPLENYTNGPATKEHLQVIFNFYSTARTNGADKNAKSVKLPDWASSFFDTIDKDMLIETSNLASYLMSKEFTEHSMSYIASKLHGMTTIEEMRAYLNEEKDFKEDEFNVLAREKSWRQDLLKWGLVTAETVRKFDEDDKKKEKKAEEQEAST